MENKLQDGANSDVWVMDRFTGRETDELQPDPKMTVVDRVDRYLAAEYELGRAERALELGAEQYEQGGGYEDITSAIEILKASAEHHAGLVDEQELAAAVEAEDVRDYEAAALLDRKAQMAKEHSQEASPPDNEAFSGWPDDKNNEAEAEKDDGWER